ncbi:MAG: zinc-binding dehydrogenase [Thermoguttaceae bacterium]|jgi:NADPH:quinone reductase-like Zn-dependent oxidoreductase
MSNFTIPNNMQAVVFDAYIERIEDAIWQLRIDTRPVPRPQRGQVLVRVEAAPCNPSDLLFLAGQYVVRKTLPAVPGWEGAGTVVQSGGGFMGNRLVGRRVAFGSQADRDGTWAQFTLADANMCIPLRARVDMEQGASLIINPITAVGLLDEARRHRHRAAVSTAAASQLGRMLLSLAREVRFPLIHVVRRSEQVDLLRSLGAEQVLNSEVAEFTDQLRDLCGRLRATVAFDAVAGEMSGKLLQAMPPKSTVLIYGVLSGENCCGIDPADLLFQDKRIEGFYLSNWLKRRGSIRTLFAANRVQRMMISGRLRTEIAHRLRFADLQQGLLDYCKNMTAGKAIITPWA